MKSIHGAIVTQKVNNHCFTNILQHTYDSYRFYHMGAQNVNTDRVPAFSLHKMTEAHHDTR